MWQDRVVGLARVSAGLLEPHPLNWRRHGGSQVEAMRQVLGRLGIAGALLVVQRGAGYMVLDGHMRSSLDREQEWPCLVLDLSDEEARSLLASYDPLGAMAEADRVALDRLLKDLALPVPTELFAPPEDKKGHGPREEADQSRAAQWVEDYAVEPGQVWELGAHRVWCGDAGLVEGVDALLALETPHLLYTDPPYGVQYTGGMLKQRPLVGDEPGRQYLLYDLARLLAPDAAVYVWTSDRYLPRTHVVLEDAGFEVAAHLIWVKNNAQFVTSAHYKAKHETCLYATRGDAPWYGGTNQVTVFEIDRAQANEYHPTQKPLEHARRCLEHSSRPGEVVLDPFLGGGTTLLAAEELSRRCIGVEIDPQYVAVTLARWEAWTGEKAVCRGTQG